MNIGDYVRGSGYDYGIKQIKQIDEYGNVFFYIKEQNYFPDIDNSSEPQYVKKSSPNIIDLIEVGDYVNGSRVVNKYTNNSVVIEKEELIHEDDGTVWNDCIEVNFKDIKSIVTKEQFKSMEYEVKE